MRTVDVEKEEQVRNEIIKAAQILFQKYGLEKTTMEDIAAALGKGKSTLYYYYKSKEDVFSAVIRRERNEVLETVKAAIKYVKSPSDQLKTYHLTLFHTLKNKLNLYPIFLRESFMRSDIYRKLHHENLMDETNMAKQILLDGIRKGEFKSITEKDCDAIALLGITMMRGIAAHSLLSGEKVPEELNLETASDVFVRGLK